MSTRQLCKMFTIVMFLLVLSTTVEAMYAESTVIQNTFWIRKVKDSVLFLRVRWNLKKVQRTDMDGEAYSMYEFEEQEILSELPFQCPLSTDEEIPLRKCSAETQNKITAYLEKNKAGFLSQTKIIAGNDPHGGQVKQFRVECINGRVGEIR